MEKITVLAPEYFKKFECIGDKCEYTCCSGWTITVDKDTYEKYQRIDEKAKKYKKEVFSPLANNYVIRNKQDKKKFSRNNYAKINLIENKCPFLDEKQLCSIYKELGPNNMPVTCKVYPRHKSKLNNTYEISLTISCPEVVKLALLNENPMAFEYIEVEKTSAYDFLDKEFNNEDNTNKPEYKYFWDIRIAAISILQDRRFYIVNRLIMLGILYKKIQDCIDNLNFENIPATIEKFMHSIEVRKNDDFLKLQKNYEKQAQIYIALLDVIFQKLDTINIKDIKIMCEEFTKELEKNSLEKFIEAKKTYFEYTGGVFRMY